MLRHQKAAGPQRRLRNARRTGRESHQRGIVLGAGNRRAAFVGGAFAEAGKKFHGDLTQRPGLEEKEPGPWDAHESLGFRKTRRVIETRGVGPGVDENRHRSQREDGKQDFVKRNRHRDKNHDAVPFFHAIARQRGRAPFDAPRQFAVSYGNAAVDQGGAIGVFRGALPQKFAKVRVHLNSFV